MIKKQKRPRDINQHAASTVELATGEVTKDITEAEQLQEATPEERHSAAVTLGRKGGQMRAMKLSSETKQRIAKKAAKARWQKIDTKNQDSGAV